MNKKLFSILLAVGSILCAPVIYAELRDPTRPPADIHGKGILSPSLFVLNAIINVQGQRIAVINGINKKIGDEVLGEHVTGIFENTVQLDGPSGRITLFIFGEPVKHLFQIVCKREWDICNDIGK